MIFMIAQPGEKKKCSKCGRYLDDDMFNKNKYLPDGLTNECKECISIYHAKGSTVRRNQYIDKVKNICADINVLLSKPEFNLDTFILNIDTLETRTVSINIPLHKTIKLVDSTEFINTVLSEITVLSDIKCEFNVFLGRPSIVVTGIVKKDE